MQEGRSTIGKTKSLRSALFFSSLRSVRFEVEDYDLRVRIQPEEYTPFFEFGTTGPYYRDAFSITLARKGHTPFIEETHYDIEKFFLNCKIDIEGGWLPIEDEEATQ